MHSLEPTHRFELDTIRRGAARDLLQRDWLDAEGACGVSRVGAEIRRIHIDAVAYQATHGRIERPHQYRHDTHHWQRDMALFRLASACAFKDLHYLVHSQVLRPTDLAHRIARARVIQRDADK